MPWPARTSARDAAPWLVLAVLLVVPVLVLCGWWAVARADNPTAAASPVQPLVVPVTRADARATTTVTVTVGDQPGREATVAAQGTVTAAPVVGAALDDGSEVLRVDDRPVRAMVAVAPPWRTLRSGDEGPDVARLQEFLARIGYAPGEADGEFGATLRRAVERFNRDAGLGVRVGTFDPATVVWIGPTPLSVHESLVTEGASVGPGSPVVRGPARPDTVSVAEPQGGVGTVGDFGTLATLVVGEAQVPYVPGSGLIDTPADVVAVRAALAPAVEGAGTLSASAPREVAVVPASALVQGTDGTTCVYPDASSAPLVVVPVGGGVANAELPADLPTDRVLANPGRVELDVACGS